MARPLRIEYPGAFYHVIQHGLEQKQIFLYTGDRNKFCHYLERAHSRYGAVVHTFVLMTTHYHIILETPRGNLSQVMHYLNMSYAACFNAARKRHGPLFQGRFKAVLVQQDEYLHHLSRYIHLNPVRAGIVQDPMEYPWSSLNYFITGCPKPQWLNTDFILSMFDHDTGKARKLYKDFILDGMGSEKDIVRKNIKEGFVLGNDAFFEKIKEKFVYGRKEPEIPLIRKLLKEPSLAGIKKLTEKNVKKDTKLKRKVGIYLSRRHTGKTLKQIADCYGSISCSAVSQAFRRMERERRKNKSLDELLLHLERGLNV